MSPATVPCIVKSCGREHDRAYLMCPWHWKRLPKLTRNAVWDALDEFDRSRSAETLHKLRGAQANAIFEAELRDAAEAKR